MNSLAANGQKDPMPTISKQSIEDLAIFGGAPQFVQVKPVSNLSKPDWHGFVAHLQPAFEQGLLGSGALVAQLEERLAAFHGVAHCVAFNSGFWALAAVMRCLSPAGRDEIVMPSLTYRRMADIAGWAGLKPRFCEVDPVRMTNTAAEVAPCLNDRTAMIMGVHPIQGLADIDGLSQLAREAGIALVFDSVESVYETHQGRRIGGFGDVEVFSLGASKLVNGFEGGYVTTDNAEHAQRLRAMLCSAPDQVPVTPGLHAHLSDVHAAMALAGLEEIDAQIERNRLRYLAYQAGLAGLSGLRLLTVDETSRPSYKNIIAEVTADWPLSRDHTVAILNAERALARAYYPQPLHTRPMGYPHIAAQLPTTEALSGRYLLLPCGELVSENDIAQICALLHFAGQHARDIQHHTTAHKKVTA